MLIQSSKNAYGYVENTKNIQDIDVDYYFYLNILDIQSMKKTFPNKIFFNLLAINTPFDKLELDNFILNDSLRLLNKNLVARIFKESYSISKSTYLIYTKNYVSLHKKLNDEIWLNLNELREICFLVSLKLNCYKETQDYFIFEIIHDDKFSGSSTYITESND
jgi:hypothetical protein